MEFNVKLQELRKNKGLTQEKLAQELLVSRTAISKWESGRGYPNLDSLKLIAKFFSVSIDELLSTDELITVAEEDRSQAKLQMRNLVFGLLDLFVGVLFFLPLFAFETDRVIHEVSLLELGGVSLYLRIIYYVMVTLTVISGVAILVLQNFTLPVWSKSKVMISMVLSAIATLVFIVSSQLYAAAFMFVLLMIKTLTLIKK